MAITFHWGLWQVSLIVKDYYFPLGIVTSKLVNNAKVLSMASDLWAATFSVLGYSVPLARFIYFSFLWPDSEASIITRIFVAPSGNVSTYTIHINIIFLRIFAPFTTNLHILDSNRNLSPVMDCIPCGASIFLYEFVSVFFFK